MARTMEPPAAQSGPCDLAFADGDPNHPSVGARSHAVEAYERILTDILRGDLSPTEDEPSSEIALQTRYGFGSRMPIRMALAVLASEGLVAQRARHGFWVVEHTERDLLQISSMRADADAMVASFLGASLTDGTITTESDKFRRIYEPLQAMDRLAIETPPGEVQLDVEMEFADHDTRFHTLIAASTGYTLAARHISQWRNLTRLYRVRHGIRYTGTNLREICGEHNKLMELIGLPVGQCPDDIDALIENAATSHIEAALSRCNLASPA